AAGLGLRPRPLGFAAACPDATARLPLPELQHIARAIRRRAPSTLAQLRHRSSCARAGARRPAELRVRAARDDRRRQLVRLPALSEPVARAGARSPIPRAGAARVLQE